jgi:hypothetical protein
MSKQKMKEETRMQEIRREIRVSRIICTEYIQAVPKMAH